MGNRRGEGRGRGGDNLPSIRPVVDRMSKETEDRTRKGQGSHRTREKLCLLGKEMYGTSRSGLKTLTPSVEEEKVRWGEKEGGWMSRTATASCERTLKYYVWWTGELPSNRY